MGSGAALQQVPSGAEGSPSPGIFRAQRTMPDSALRLAL